MANGLAGRTARARHWLIVVVAATTTALVGCTGGGQQVGDLRNSMPVIQGPAIRPGTAATILLERSTSRSTESLFVIDAIYLKADGSPVNGDGASPSEGIGWVVTSDTTAPFAVKSVSFDEGETARVVSLYTNAQRVPRRGIDPPECAVYVRVRLGYEDNGGATVRPPSTKSYDEMWTYLIKVR